MADVGLSFSITLAWPLAASAFDGVTCVTATFDAVAFDAVAFGAITLEAVTFDAVAFGAVELGSSSFGFGGVGKRHCASEGDSKMRASNSRFTTLAIASRGKSFVRMLIDVRFALRRRLTAVNCLIFAFWPWKIGEQCR